MITADDMKTQSSYASDSYRQGGEGKKRKNSRRKWQSVISLFNSIRHYPLLSSEQETTVGRLAKSGDKKL